jgi:hypothetical protein
MDIWTSDLTEKLREEIRMHSDEIARIKKSEMETEPGRAWRYVDEDGKQHRRDAEGRKGQYVDVDVIVKHITPKSDSWLRYLSHKEHVSIRLVALRIARELELDANKGQHLTRSHVFESMKRSLPPHFHPRKRKKMAKRAARLIRRLSNELCRKGVAA